MTNNDSTQSVSPVRAKAGSVNSKRRWLPYAGAAILLALIVAGLWPKPTPVETARVTMGPLQTTITEEGKMLV